MCWGEKRYYSLDYYLKETFHEKLYKLSLNAGCTCPNRDGTCGSRGCIFCSRGGSGDFAASPFLSIAEQLRSEKARIASKYRGHAYIAYFQAYTNTYGSVNVLERTFFQAIEDPEVKVLSIATRPDCLPPEILNLLERLNRIKPVWIELGLQTIHTSTAAYIRRGYPLSVFEEAVRTLRAIGISVIVHTILYLPGESKAQMLETIEYLNLQEIQGIKLQLLHVLRDTDLYNDYQRYPFPLPSMEEYLDFLGTCLCALRPDIVVHRLTGDGPKYTMSETFTLYKLIILYMLSKVDFPLTNAQISDFILGKGYTTYFTLQKALSELTESGLIREETTHNRTLYHLTEEGDESICFFENKISDAIKKDISDFFIEKKFSLKNEVSVKSDYYRNTNGEFSVHCQVIEHAMPLIDLTVTVPSREEAETMAANWNARNQEIYAYIMTHLL